jgi:hypothetical protein
MIAARLTCPSCGSDRVAEVIVTRSFTYVPAGAPPVTLQATYPAIECYACDMEFSGEAADQARETALAAYLKGRGKA